VATQRVAQSGRGSVSSERKKKARLAFGLSKPDGPTNREKLVSRAWWQEASPYGWRQLRLRFTAHHARLCLAAAESRRGGQLGRTRAVFLISSLRAELVLPLALPCPIALLTLLNSHGRRDLSERGILLPALPPRLPPARPLAKVTSRRGGVADVV
jgi:hypothetical protein